MSGIGDQCLFVLISSDSGMFKDHSSFFNNKYLLTDSVPGILLGTAFQPPKMLSRSWIRNWMDRELEPSVGCKCKCRSHSY